MWGAMTRHAHSCGFGHIHSAITILVGFACFAQYRSRLDSIIFISAKAIWTFNDCVVFGWQFKVLNLLYTSPVTWQWTIPVTNVATICNFAKLSIWVSVCWQRLPWNRWNISQKCMHVPESYSFIVQQASLCGGPWAIIMWIWPHLVLHAQHSCRSTFKVVQGL